MRILALDQATSCGWAVTETDGTVVASGVWKLADRNRTGESRGMRYIRFRSNLRHAIELYKPGMICHEQTLLRGGAATEIANGLKALILETAAELGLEVSCVHTSELKHWATGNGRAEKADMVKAAERLGNRPVACDDEADAILIGLWASAVYGAFPGPQWPSRKKAGKRKKESGSWLDEL